MKQSIIIIAFTFYCIFGFAQTEKMPTANLMYNSNVGTKNEDLTAAALLYDEINYYRNRNGVGYCTVVERMVKYASRWNCYMMDHHIDQDNTFYKHSTFSPDESLIIPSNTGEIIHCVYFKYKPSSFEAAFSLMYGLNRGSATIIGWTQSPLHNKCILEPNLIYYGVSVYIAKKDKWWVVYGTVNFSYDK